MIKFGTDGWRAIIGEEFTFENVERLIQTYVDVIGANGQTVVLGHDRRFQSRDFARRAAAVLAANGFTVLFSKDYCPTPCISWMTKTQKAAGGVVITASHNPFQWNGIKFKESYGGSASPEFTKKIEERCLQVSSPKRIPFETALREGRIREFDPKEGYVNQLKSLVDVKKIAEAGWRIAYDPLYGAGAGYLSRVLGTSVHEIHGEANPGFAGLNPEPIEKNLGELMSLLRSGNFDVGLATDGDADRIGAVDENGNFVTPHQIFALIMNHLLEKGLTGEVVKTVSTTAMIDRIAEAYKIRVHETPIGFKHICNRFRQVNPLMGGEESGGIGIPSHVYERDGLLSGLLLLEIMSVKKKRLGELLRDLSREFGSFHFRREDVHLSEGDRDRVATLLEKDVPQTIGGLKVLGINRLDGLKYLLEDQSWLLFRLSGTEPLLRIYAESSKPELSRQLVAEGRRHLQV